MGQGGSGSLHSTASTSLANSLVTAVQSQAQAPVNGTGTAIAWAAIGNGADPSPVMVTDQAVALLTAEPTTTDVNNVLSNNANISTAFTAGSPTYFGIGELGGAYAYSSNDTASETEISAVHMTVDLTKVSPLSDLIIGFYSGAAAGTGFTGMSLDVKINGTDNITNFASVADADAYFNNGGLGNAVDYGTLSTLGTSTLQLDISLTITEATAGGYDFGMLIGDPPPASDAAAHHNLVAGMASFGVNGSDPSATFAPLLKDNHQPALAPHPA
jgi:hypothetical protein